MIEFIYLESTANEGNLSQFLAKWAVQHNVAQKTVDSLISGIRENINTVELPGSSKTLLKTARFTSTYAMNDGSYSHIGVAKCLSAVCSALSKCNHPIPDEFILDFNIDGVSYSKSTKSSLEIIQMSLRNIELDPLVVGVYCGIEKPVCNVLLRDFVNDINALIPDGFQYCDKNIAIKIGNFCCDTPAVSYIRGTKGHAGYNSCTKCTQKGIRLDYRLVFPYITKGNRTNEDFRSRNDPSHHVKPSILESIESLDMVRSFPVDVMHVVHLGVVKKLVVFWLKELSKNELEAIGSRVLIAEKYRPVEIRRQIRHLTCVNLFKAKEFRTLLMYTGPFILKDILDRQKYDHFLLLHFAMRKLGYKKHHYDIESIQNLLEKFVQQFKTLYGLNSLTYVVHSVIHLCDDVELYGIPENFSAYKYENNNNKIVQNIRHGKNVSQQIHNRSIERMNSLSIKSIVSQASVRAKYVDKVEKKTKFRKVSFKQLTFDKSVKNQWILTKDREICCFEFAEIVEGKIKIKCRKICQDLDNFYSHPFKSSEVDIFYVNTNNNRVEYTINIDDIAAKMYCLANEDIIVLIEIINE